MPTGPTTRRPLASAARPPAASGAPRRRHDGALPGPSRERARRRAPAPALPSSRRALLLVDVINPLDFEGAEQLAPGALEAARAIAALKRRLAADGVPALYVNDNFGRWRSDFEALLADCRRRQGPAATLARLLAPAKADLTVLKPRQSAFHETPLELLLSQIGARELVITGLAADLCVQFSAMDAYVRGYRLWVPEDCTAAETPERKRAALEWMARALKCRIAPAGPARR